jgi:hypothetical protein
VVLYFDQQWIVQFPGSRNMQPMKKGKMFIFFTYINECTGEVIWGEVLTTKMNVQPANVALPLLFPLDAFV